jgi:general nucleoside transport system ATP-binding protein
VTVTDMPEFAFEMRGIFKHFGALPANADVDLAVRVGEIHCLVGENGAGKTTLMNILYGLVQSDEGEIRVFGQPVTIHNPEQALRLGIGMVHQHFMLVDSYTVTENVMLGRERQRGLLVDDAVEVKIVQELARQYGLRVDARAPVRTLPVGLRQRVEILKILYRGSRIIILDEPTAVLTPQESQELFATIKKLVAAGKTIIFITHKLKEVMAVADRVTVLRQGRVVGALSREEVNEERLSTLMVGRHVLFKLDKAPAKPGRTVLEVRGLSIVSSQGHLGVRNVSFSTCAGEIVTMAGVEGNGQSELIEAMAGLRPAVAGEVFINDQRVTNLPPDRIRAAGLTHVPADRMAIGLSIQQSVAENLIAGRHRRAPLSNGFFLNLAQMRDFAASAMKQFDVRAASPNVPARTLSGGNMQKLVLARELSFESDLLVAALPTRGVDVAAIEAIHQMLIRARDRGQSILVVSTDLDEVFQISDRILVLYNGEIVGEFAPNAITREELGFYMIGGRRQDRAAHSNETTV